MNSNELNFLLIYMHNVYMCIYILHLNFIIKHLICSNNFLETHILLFYVKNNNIFRKATNPCVLPKDGYTFQV